MEPDRRKMERPANSLSLSAAIEIKEKEAEFLKVLRRLEELGVDYKIDFPIADDSPGILASTMPSTSGSIELPSLKQADAVDESTGEAAAPMAPTAEKMAGKSSSSPQLFGRYELPPEPKLEDFGFTEETMNMCLLHEQGLPFPAQLTPHARYRRVASPSPMVSHRDQKQEYPTVNSTGIKRFETPKNVKAWTTPKTSNLQLELVCTPDLYHTKRLMVPRNSNIPRQMNDLNIQLNQPSARSAALQQSASAAASHCRPTPPKVERLTATSVMNDPNSFFGLRSPTTPTFSADFTYANTGHQIKQNFTVSSPAEPEMNSLPRKSRGKSSKKSPKEISPEMTLSLNWVKIK